jgi:hypothetical protein
VIEDRGAGGGAKGFWGCLGREAGRPAGKACLFTLPSSSWPGRPQGTGTGTQITAPFSMPQPQLQPTTRFTRTASYRL